MRALLEAGVAPDAVDADGRTPLEHAVRRARLSLVRLLLSFGAKPQPALWTALWPCTEVAPALAPAVLTALLDAGADPSSKEEAADEDAGGLGRSAIHDAVKHPELVSLLLERGADPNRATATFETPLSFACDWGLLPSVAVLLAGGANPNHILEDLGWSVLMVAAMSGHDEVIVALLDAGADPAWVNERGDTALSVALDHRKSRACAVLLERAPAIAGLGTADLVSMARRIPDEELARRIESLRRSEPRAG